MPPPPLPTPDSSARRTKARNAALINQLATPGLGSLLAGCRWAGAGQLLLSVTGFCLVVAWFGMLMWSLYQAFDTGQEGKSVAWVGELGAALFALAWIWALFTSLSLLRQSREEQANEAFGADN